MDWLRWHRGSATDPRLRVVARRSGQSIPLVLAVLAFLKEAASEGEVRGVIDAGRWSDEDVGAAMDVDASAVLAVREAMEGKYLEGWRMLDWERENPKRERDNDLSTDRVRAFRERSRAKDGDAENETPRNATKRQRTPRVDKRRVEESRGDIPPMGEIPPSEGAPAAPDNGDGSSGEEKANRLVKWFIDHRRKAGMSDLSRAEISQMAGIAKTICDRYPAERINLARRGIVLIFPYAPPPAGRGEPWTLKDLLNRFTDACTAAERPAEPAKNGKGDSSGVFYEPGPERF